MNWRELAVYMQLVGGVDVLIQRSAHEKPERPLWLSSTVFNDDKNSPEMDLPN